MPKNKGTDIVTLKELFSKEKKDLEETFLSKLSENDRKTYNGILATSWTDIEIVNRIYETAAETLYPGKGDACVKLGQMLAEKVYSGIYSVFLLIPKASYVMKRAANVWKSYHDKGDAKVESINDNSIDFIVQGYPDLPKAIRDGTTGHISVLLGKTGLKNLNVKHDESNPSAWVWHTTWS